MMDIMREGDFNAEGECLAGCEDVRRRCIEQEQGTSTTEECSRIFRDCTSECDHSVGIPKF